jgi:hypothetical protein
MRRPTLFRALGLGLALTLVVAAAEPPLPHRPAGYPTWPVAR